MTTGHDLYHVLVGINYESIFIANVTCHIVTVTTAAWYIILLTYIVRWFDVGCGMNEHGLIPIQGEHGRVLGIFATLVKKWGRRIPVTKLLVRSAHVKRGLGLCCTCNEYQAENRDYFFHIVLFFSKTNTAYRGNTTYRRVFFCPVWLFTYP